MTAFINRPNSKFSTNLSQAIGDLVTTTWNVNAVPTKVPCVLIVDPGLATQEKVQCTGTGAGTITVVRNYDAKGANTHAFNATIVDYDAPEYIYDIADVIEQNFNSDKTPISSIFLKPDFATVFSNFVASGLVIPTSGTLSATCPLGVIYYNGTRYAIASDGGHTYTANQDTYVDVNPATGTYAYNGVANGSAAPALTANSLRIAKVVTNGSAVTGVTQTGFDSIGNPIYPNKAVQSGALRRFVGNAALGSNFSTTSLTFTDVTGLSVTVVIPVTSNVKISVFGRAQNNSEAKMCQFQIVRGVTALRQAQIQNPTTAQASNADFGYMDLSLAAGTYTYKIQMSTDGANADTVLAMSGMQLIVEAEAA